ncbi:MAG: hypothetical protein Q8876_02165, partial [Bacillota bacterium]|nr:hypothetical protein [Bacillota bacterium]
SSDSIISYDLVCSIDNLCILKNSPATLQLESAFNMFKNIDIGLFAGAIIFMIYDIRNIVRQQ